MKNLSYLLLLLLTVSSCGNIQKKQEQNTLTDKTPIVQDALKETPPDMTFNDVGSVLNIIRNNTEFDQFDKVLVSADMINVLDSIEDVTAFAPVNDAFTKITDSKLAQLKSPDGKQEMTEILNYHIVNEEYDKTTLTATIRNNEGVLRLKTVNGGYIALSIKDAMIVITDEIGTQSEVILADQKAENGVLHGISNLLLPQ